MTTVQALQQSRLAQWAVGIASAAAGLVVADIMALGAFVLFQGRIDDTWVGAVGMYVLFAGLVAAFLSFLLGLAARIKHNHWVGLRLPLALFPSLMGLLLLGELLWWE